jgi:ABC-type arginine transport system ATPase subunit
MVYTVLLATVYFAIKALVDSDIAANAALHRPIHVTAPLGSIVNSVSPAAVAFARDVSSRVVFLDQGVVVEDGEPHAVFAVSRSERFRQFLGTPSAPCTATEGAPAATREG